MSLLNELNLPKPTGLLEAQSEWALNCLRMIEEAYHQQIVNADKDTIGRTDTSFCDLPFRGHKYTMEIRFQRPENSIPAMNIQAFEPFPITFSQDGKSISATMALPQDDNAFIALSSGDIIKVGDFRQALRDFMVREGKHVEKVDWSTKQ